MLNNEEMEQLETLKNIDTKDFTADYKESRQ